MTIPPSPSPATRLFDSSSDEDEVDDEIEEDHGTQNLDLHLTQPSQQITQVANPFQSVTVNTVNKRKFTEEEDKALAQVHSHINKNQTPN
jgi:hypothetical protein